MVLLGNINLDFLKWKEDNLPANDSIHKVKPLINELFARIVPHGVSQLVNKATRVSSRDGVSGLDHVYSNRPNKCSEVAVNPYGESDHRVVRMTRFSKDFIRRPKLVTKRIFKNFDRDAFLQDISELS